MVVDTAPEKSHKISSYDDLLQPVVYGVLPDASNAEISLGDLVSKLVDQKKTFLGVLFGGTLLAFVLSLVLPVVYQPSITVSAPLVGDVASLTATNTLIGDKASIPSSPQAVFTSYFELLRSKMVMAEYLHELGYLEKLYPDSVRHESVMVADLFEGLKINILEPMPEHKGGYISDPKRVSISIDVEHEILGVELLNGFTSYVNQKLITNFQNDAGEIIKNKIDVFTRQIAKLRGEGERNRALNIEKIEAENAKEIALLQEQIAAYLIKAKANRVTQIALAKDALEMAKSLNIEYPTTLNALAQKGQKGKTVGTAITVTDKQISSLYLQGSKYLNVLITTLENRENDEDHLLEINNLREKIHVLENDQELVALRARETDDPWIEGLSAKLAEIDALKRLSPNFLNLVAFDMDEAAIVTHQKVGPKRTLVVAIGFVLSLFFAFFVALVMASIKAKPAEPVNP